MTAQVNWYFIRWQLEGLDFPYSQNLKTFSLLSLLGPLGYVSVIRPLVVRYLITVSFCYSMRLAANMCALVTAGQFSKVNLPGLRIGKHLNAFLRLNVFFYYYGAVLHIGSN